MSVSTQYCFVSVVALVFLGASCATTNPGPIVVTNPPAWDEPDSGARVVGLYAVISLINPHEDGLKDMQASCEKSGHKLDIDGDVRRVSEGSYFWLYRTSTTTLVFSREFVLIANHRECTVKIVEKRDVVRQSSTDRWPFPFKGGTMNGFDGYQITQANIRGLKARCKSVGDLVGQSECVSAERGLSRRMLL